MARIRKSTVENRHFKWNFFQRSTELHFFLLLVVADALFRMVGGDISVGLNALCGIGLFCFLITPMASMFANLFFEAIEMLTRNGPSNRPPQSKYDNSSKDDPPPNGKSQPNRNRTSKGNGNSKGSKYSHGEESASNTHTPRVNGSSDGTGHSKPGAATASSPESKSPQNFLARFASEIRLQIFKYYFTLFRPEGYFREAFYRNIGSMNLLNALKNGQSDQSLYDEALSEFRKSHQLGLLLEGGRVGRGFIDFMDSELLKSLKDITFGPGTIETLMRPSSVIINSWNSPHSSFDIAERKSRWYSFQTAELFGENSRLAQAAQGLENITIFMEGIGKIDTQRLIDFSTIPSATFPNLRKICYCFPEIFPKMEWNREYLNTLIFLLNLKIGQPRIRSILNFQQYPWKSVSYGCQYEVSGFSWDTKDDRKIELEFVIYPS